MTDLALLIAPIGGLLIAGFLVWYTGKSEKTVKSHHPAE